MSTPPPYGAPGQDPYGQPPGYGQPGYGQPDSYGQPGYGYGPGYGTPPPGYGTPGYGTPPPGYGYPPMPGGFGGPPPGGMPIPNYLWQSIVTTVLCCLPAGVIALVYSTRVQPKQQMGDIQGALEASKKAKTWCIVSAAVAGAGILLYVLYIIIVVVAFASGVD
ncbi:CD225/dispanin family protein [Frankia nepalensis]|uniref:CD225/dispanin family protein n=1 Tax=Frankia nepalensis TaxID=1836974 RepID=A0A937USQ0_9ACTN|nr:CD225/dispanin family protein [Frankia nepalensis]MBL7500716.1 CD225/dispanin family protein [Frankia nepalensis]MBL7516238.1 CD225/dispanin family protein [Frankia nepalensis]MBL7632732.1 CD225/dispanin family protein [Frankia nepalensis]